MKKTVFKILIGVILLIILIGIFLIFSKDVTYLVTFDSMGGSNVDAQIIKKGESATKPDNPQKEGFTFVEWQLNNMEYDFDTAVSNDLVLKAFYTINEATEVVVVMLDYQNGQEIRKVEIIKGGIMYEPPIPSKEGFDFEGWYINDDKYDFSSILNENITLTARWEEKKGIDSILEKVTDTKNNTANNNSTVNILNNSSSNSTIINENSTTNDSTTTQEFDFKSIVDKYSGTWYLEGYSDVYLYIFESSKDLGLGVDAINIALPFENGQTGSSVNPFTIYPYKNFLNEAPSPGWCSGFEIINDPLKWEETLLRYKLVFSNNCILMNNNRFVKNKGNKDQYSDTCYRQALGVWYLENRPNSTLEISTIEDNGETLGHRFGITASNFNFETLSTDNSCFVDGWAGRKNNWEQYGISVSGKTLTVSNKNGIRTFHKNKSYQKVTGITLDTTNVSLSVGETKAIMATVSPSDAYDKSVTWSSSNPTVATVSSTGIITAKGEGTTTISVNSKDGNHSASCKVTVSIIHVNGISIDKKSLCMTIGDVQQLNYTISPSNAVNKNVSWSSSNLSVAQVSSSGKVTAKGKGTTIITIKSAEGNYTATCSITVQEPTLKVSTSIGVGYYMSDSASVRGVFAKVTPTGGSGNYIEYSLKLYYNGSLVAESNKNEVIVSPVKNGTYKVDVYVKDSSGNEIRDTKTTTISY